MENASDAIIMAGAMLIFVMAISIIMPLISQARRTVDTVVYASDATNYYEYMGIDENKVAYRVVGLETVIPTLYKYYKENYTVVFLKSNGTAYPLYQSSGEWNEAEKKIVTKYGLTGKNICSFDLSEEIARGEPWTGDTADIRAHLDAFINGKKFSDSYDYSGGKGLINMFSGKQFYETIGEYSTRYSTGHDLTAFATELNKGVRDNKNKRVIVYKEK